MGCSCLKRLQPSQPWTPVIIVDRYPSASTRQPTPPSLPIQSPADCPPPQYPPPGIASCLSFLRLYAPTVHYTSSSSSRSRPVSYTPTPYPLLLAQLSQPKEPSTPNDPSKDGSQVGTATQTTSASRRGTLMAVSSGMAQVGEGSSDCCF